MRVGLIEYSQMALLWLSDCFQMLFVSIHSTDQMPFRSFSAPLIQHVTYLSERLSEYLSLVRQILFRRLSHGIPASGEQRREV